LELFLIKLPNFLAIDPRPFNPETYALETEDIKDEAEVSGDSSRMNMKVENTVMWRHSAVCPILHRMARRSPMHDW
jgi:Leo1-like protein